MADPACPPIPPLAIQLTGPLVVGYQLNWCLYGVLSVQVYIYSQTATSDPRKLKLLVYGLYLLETVQVILATHDSFHELALSWGIFSGLTDVYLTWLTLPVMTGITSATIQCFYAWRIYALSSSKILALFIAAVALMQGSAAVAEGLQILISQDVPGTQVDTYKTTIVWLGGTAGCDVIICCCMVWLLSRKRTAFRDTNTVLNRLIAMIVETGLATAVFAIIELSLFLTFKNNFYHVAPSLILSKLYSNSLLVLLNNRLSIRYSQPDIRLEGSQMSTRAQAMIDRSAIQVNINRETYNENLAMVALSKESPREPRMGKKSSSLDLTDSV